MHITYDQVHAILMPLTLFGVMVLPVVGTICAVISDLRWDANNKNEG